MTSRNDAAAPRPWGGWRGWWDERLRTVTSGGGIGTAGAARGFLAVAAFVVFVNSTNVLTALHDAARRGHALPVWEPATWEATSGVAGLLACPIVFLALRLAPPGRVAWWRAALAHGCASVAFSGLHVGLMMAARIGVYGALGFRYRVEPGAWVYEYRKDLVSYLVVACLFQLFARRQAAAPVAVAAAAAAPAVFDIVEGAQVRRVPVASILAVRSAGNYVEFWLEDARRPLMRATLRDLEGQLAPLGFVRTHRSWLVNAARVEGLTPSGSGDHDVALAGGMAVPLSRRYRAALQCLRASPFANAP